MDSPRDSARVPLEDQGQRLDAWLCGQSESLSRSRVQKLIAQGHVTVNGQARPARYRVRPDDDVSWQVPPAEETDLTADASVDFRILHQDADLAVVDKPAGLVVHPAPGHGSGTLIHGLMARLDQLSGVGGRARPGLVHRLDKDTSGLLVVAKNDAAHAHLVDQLKQRSLQREYWALCWGRPEPDEGSIEAPLARHPRDRKRQAVVETGRPARTHYWVRERLRGASQLELHLDTGRTHQIRVHLAHRGHPVLADELYGGGEKRLKGASPDHREALKQAVALAGRQALHACALALDHPSSGERLRFESPLPAELRGARDALRYVPEA